MIIGYSEQQSPYYKDNNSTRNGEKNMCEFNVILDGKSQIKDIIYAKSANNNVTVKNILGETKEFKNCRILEVDVSSERLLLESMKP